MQKVYHNTTGCMVNGGGGGSATGSRERGVERSSVEGRGIGTVRRSLLETCALAGVEEMSVSRHGQTAD
jgi:hypothetical protein